MSVHFDRSTCPSTLINATAITGGTTNVLVIIITSATLYKSWIGTQYRSAMYVNGFLLGANIAYLI